MFYYKVGKGKDNGLAFKKKKKGEMGYFEGKMD